MPLGFCTWSQADPEGSKGCCAVDSLCSNSKDIKKNSSRRGPMYVAYGNPGAQSLHWGEEWKHLWILNSQMLIKLKRIFKH